MTKKIVWLVVSCLMVAAPLLVSCGPAAVEEEEKVVTPEEEVVAEEKEEEEAPPPEEEAVAPPEEEEEEAPPPEEEVVEVQEEEESTLLADPILTDAGLVSGTVVGDAGEEVRSYKGIPFAAPPVGDLRWRPPQPVEPWDGVLQCTEFAPIAPQSKDYASSRGKEQSEDCLYLNVYTPAKETTDRLPVFVNIHGGGMTVGSSHWPDMTYFAQNNGVVGVSIAYRLGELGFMAHPLLSEESGNGVSGNYGLMDQVAALEWVQGNIAAFGGDPDNVTIHGCSAGGESVLFLTASPFGKGLFHRAIADAGVYGSTRSPPLADMEQWGNKLVDNLGVSDEPDVLAALRAISADEIVEAGGEELSNVDGWFLPDLPLELFRAGNQQDVPLMIGSGSDDLFGTWNQYGDRDYASAMNSVSSKVYAWVFDHAPCGSGGGTHCLDLTYLFADLGTREDMCDVDFEIAEAMVAMWVQFAKTGNPNVDGLIEWPAYEAATDQYLEIGDPLQVETGLYEPGKHDETPAEPVTYTNADYGFRIKYPDNWVDIDVIHESQVFYATAPLGVPSIGISILESELTYWETEIDALESIDGSDFEVIYERTGKLADGTPITEIEVRWVYMGYDVHSFCMGVQLDGKWLSVVLTTIDSLVPYDEDFCREIAYSLEFE